MIPPPSFDTDYLKIPKQLYEKVHHDENYIKQGNGKKGYRKIFAKVSYDQFEKENIINFQTYIKQSKIIFPQRIIEEDRLLRYLYSASFEIDKAFEILTSHFEWMSNEENFKILPKTKEYLEKGAIYVAGRDKKYRPIIVINVKMLYGNDFTLPSFMNSLYAVFNVCREVIFIPGIIENWVLIIETSELSMMSFPYDVLGVIIKTASLQYSGTMEKIYITNPSTSFNICWAIIAKFLDERTLYKINKLKKNEFHKMFDLIPPEQLEKKYGGTLENITSFWPPIDPLKEEKQKLLKSQPRINEKLEVSSSSLQGTRRLIFDESNLVRTHSPFLHEELEEIITYRKSKNATLMKDLYEDFPRNSKKSVKTSHITNHQDKIHSSMNGRGKNEDFKLMYKGIYNERKTSIDSTIPNKRESGFCGLCLSDRKQNDPYELNSKKANISICLIF